MNNMNDKSNLTLWLLISSIVFMFNQRNCWAVGSKLYTTQEKLVKEAEMKIETNAELSNTMKRDILSKTGRAIARPARRPTSPLQPIKRDIDKILAKEQVSPEQIAEVRNRLANIRLPDDAGIDKPEYEHLKENLDIVYESTKRIAELEESYESTVKNLNSNFNKLAGRFDVSFIGNIVMVLGLITKFGSILNWKLDRQLKLLEIEKKKSELK